MSVEICFGVPTDQRTRTAKIAFEAFGDFINNLLGSKSEIVTLVAAYLRDDRMLVALKGGVVVGCAGLEHSGKGFIKISFREAVRTLGLNAFLIVIFHFVMIFSRASPCQVHVQALAVSEKERGKGIGSKLLEASIDYARSKGFSQVKLEVTDTNPRARRLYERIGFIKTNARNIPYPFSRIIGIGRVIEMIYRL